MGAVILALLCLTIACSRHGTGPSTADARVVTDEIGRRVEIRGYPQRIVSLAPSITEILFSLELGDKIVGVTSYCDYPPEATNIERIGDTLHPQLERIIALKPDLVIITTASQLEQLTRNLDKLSIPVFVSNPRTIRGVIGSIRTLGNLTGSVSTAEKIANDMEHRVNAVEETAQKFPPVSVFYVLQTAPLITAGRNTFINDMITLAGGESISGNESADYPQFSRETVIVRAPEVIVAPGSHGTGFVREDDLKRDFATTPAIENNRIVRIDPDLIDRPGPRIIQGLEQLAQGLHPGKQGL